MAALQFNPLRNPEAFDKLVAAGISNPGLFQLVDGGGRPFKWDIKDVAGAQGATETYRGWRPSEGIHARFVFWTAEQIDEFFTTYLPLFEIDGTKTSATPVAVQHPVLNANNIFAVVAKEIGPLVDVERGKQLWSVTLELIEFRPAKKANVTKTPDKASEDGTGKREPSPQDAQDQEIAALLAEANKPFP